MNDDEQNPFRLRTDMPAAHVLAKDPANGLVLLGGLGVMGVGKMVVAMQPCHERRAGYADAEVRDLGVGNEQLVEQLVVSNALREASRRRPS